MNLFGMYTTPFILNIPCAFNFTIIFLMSLFGMCRLLCLSYLHQPAVENIVSILEAMCAQEHACRALARNSKTMGFLFMTVEDSDSTIAVQCSLLQVILSLANCDHNIVAGLLV